MTQDAAAAPAAGRRTIAVIGGGPAGLMAAESLAADHDVTVFDRMPGVGRKFLMAGRGGLNLTHGEPRAAFVARYREAAARLEPIVAEYPPEALRAWCESLGQPTFVGSSGRVFPLAMKASPLLRAWLRRLDALGVRFALGRRWLGWDARGALRFAGDAGAVETVRADATILALGGASWPRLGADGGWVAILREAGIAVADLVPANCGVHVAWSAHLAAGFAGAPLKRIALTAGGERVRGEAVITARGLEGGGVYALSGPLRAQIAAHGSARLLIDLRPDLGTDALAAKLRGARRGARSLASFLRSVASLAPPAIALLREVHGRAVPEDPARLAAAIKAVEIEVAGLAPIDRAISSAGGITWNELGDDLMLLRKPGVFACGEMIDWDAPTGGYLLQACFATARRAADGANAFTRSQG
jgi:hypothetical protein